MMKHKRLKGTFMIGLILAGLLTMPASAIDYQISGVAQADFYTSTLYEDVYGTEYQYGGTNVSDFDIPALVYGSLSTTSIGVLDKATSSFGISYASTSFASVTTTGTYGYTYDYTYTSPTYTSPTYTVQTTQFTNADDIVRSDGTIGTLYIPAIDVYATVKANEVMSYSVGHISSTSAWNGNVGICGHNRGASVTIGDIKDLELGDEILYATDLGTRSYSVISVKQISSTDWSDLTATSDNRITLITCVENESDMRWCVVAVAN